MKEMKISREELLANETWIDPFAHVVLTSDVTWEDGAGEVCHGFNMKVMAESDHRPWRPRRVHSGEVPSRRHR